MFYFQGEQIGMININMCPKTLVERWASFIQNLVQVGQFTVICTESKLNFLFSNRTSMATLLTSEFPGMWVLVFRTLKCRWTTFCPNYWKTQPEPQLKLILELKERVYRQSTSRLLPMREISSSSEYLLFIDINQEVFLPPTPSILNIWSKHPNLTKA